MAPPPATIFQFLTKHLNTQSASCRDLSASSITRLEEPRMRILEVVGLSTSI